MQQITRGIHRHITAYLVLCLTTVCGSAQSNNLSIGLGLSLRFPTSLPSQLDEWSTHSETSELRLTIRTDTVLRVKIRTVVRCDSTIVLYTRLADVPELEVQHGAVQKSLEEFLPLSSIQFMSTFGERCARNGRLTPGTYSIRCQAVDAANTDRVLAQSDPLNFTIRGVSVCQLIEPVQFHSITPNKAVRFVWSSVKPAPRSELGIRYKLLIYEAPRGMEAQSVVETMEPTMELTSSADSPTVISITAGKFHWSPKHDYVWTVRSIDKDGHAYGEHDGLAEPRVFRVKH